MALVGMRRASPFVMLVNSRQHSVPGLFEKCNCLFPSYGGEIVEKFVKRFPALNVIDECLHGHASACEARRASHNRGVGDN